MSDPLPPLRSQSVRPGTRDRVVDVTRILMIENGLNAVKARVVAKAAGTSVGTIYNLFGHLDDLVRDINGNTYDDLYAAETSALAAARENELSPTDQLLALADAYLEWVERNQSLWLAALAFNRSRSGAPPEWYARKEQALFEIIEDALTSFPGDLDEQTRKETARALWASIHGIVTMALADGFLLQPLDAVSRQMRIVVEAVAERLERGAL